MPPATPILTKLAQLGGEGVAVTPNDGELLSYRSSPNTWANRPRLLLKDGAADLVSILDSGSASGCMFAIVLDDGNTFNMVLRNDTFSTDVFDGLFHYIQDSGRCISEPFRNSTGTGMDYLVKGGDAAGGVMADGGILDLRGGSPVAGGLRGPIFIGFADADRIGFHGVTGQGRANHIPDATGGGTIDAENRTVTDAILVVLEDVGLVKTS